MLGNKVTIHISDDGGATYGDSIGRIINLEPGERTVETQESHEYGADHDWKEHDYGLMDGGEWSITVRYKPDQLEIESLIDAQENATKPHIQIRFPSPIAKTMSFRALVTKVAMATPLGSRIERTISLKVDGPVVEGDLS